MSDQRILVSLDQLLAGALAIEQEAVERYEELADQMEVHNNREVAELFRKLASIEAEHVTKVNTLSEGRRLPPVSIWDAPWQDMESPEALARDEVHYLMTPYHALSLALEGEERAVAFFARIMEAAQNEEVSELAAQFRDEEEEHVVLLKEWLGRYPVPAEGWDHDPDPPVTHE